MCIVNNSIKLCILHPICMDFRFGKNEISLTFLARTQFLWDKGKHRKDQWPLPCKGIPFMNMQFNFNYVRWLTALESMEKVAAPEIKTIAIYNKKKTETLIFEPCCFAASYMQIIVFNVAQNGKQWSNLGIVSSYHSPTKQSVLLTVLGVTMECMHQNTRKGHTFLVCMACQSTSKKVTTASKNVRTLWLCTLYLRLVEPLLSTHQ